MNIKYKKKAKNQKIRSNVLLIGNYGDYNIGDEAILKVILFDLIKKKKKFKVFIPTRNQNFMNLYHENLANLVHPFYAYDLKSLIKYTFNSGEVIIGGGGIWSGYTGKLAKLIPLFIIFSKMLGKKVIVKGVGIYDTASRVERWLVNFSFIFVDECSVRDKESLSNIWNKTREIKKVKLVKDLALNLPQYIKADDEVMFKNSPYFRLFHKIRAEGRCIVGLSVKPLKDSKKTKNLIKIFIRFINSTNSVYNDKIHFVFFPFAKTSSDIEDDMKLSDEIIKHLEFNVTVLPHMSPAVWYLFIRECVDVFIGMRFHSIIFAYLANKPFLAIPYENKVWNFVKEICHEDVLELKNIDEKQMSKFLIKNLRMG